MDETWILQRFLARDEEGLAAAYTQLGPGLTALAARIAGPETAEECVNDALLAAWQAIPPLAPVHLAAYLAKLTRNAALNRYRAQNAQKRGGSIVAVSLDELAEYGREGRGACKPGGVGFHSLRAGDITSDHKVYFGGMGERLEITHYSYGDDCFARGAVDCAAYLQGKPAGVYSIKDVFDLR